MIRKIRLFITLAAIAVSATACLDKLPESGIPADKAIRTLSDAEQAMTGIYSEFKSGSLYNGYLTLCPDIQSDLVHAVEGYTNTYGDIWRWEILANNPEITAVYASLYGVIGRCNFFLEYVEPLRASLTNDDDLDRLQELEGAVYFARALSYSELIKMFCKPYESDEAARNELGIVWVSSYSNPEHPRRSTLFDSYKHVLDDLAKAEEYIELELQSQSNSVYFSKSVVNALYARIYLYMRRWADAVEYSSRVIEDENLRLASTTTIRTGTKSEYRYMWTNDDSDEIIWKVGLTPTSYGRSALGRVFLNYNYVTFRPDYVPATWALNLYATNDRRYGTLFESIRTGYPHGLTWPLLIKYLGNEAFIAQRILHVNMPKPFRLSEQYLIRAEAYCEQGDYTRAARDITTLRTARYSTYGSTSVTENNWLQTISDERVRELFMEGFRLQDLKRWGRGFERTPQQSSIKEGSSLKIAANDPLFVWPIPQHELDVPGSDIEPNESNK